MRFLQKFKWKLFSLLFPKKHCPFGLLTAIRPKGLCQMITYHNVISDQLVFSTVQSMFLSLKSPSFKNTCSELPLGAAISGVLFVISAALENCGTIIFGLAIAVSTCLEIFGTISFVFLICDGELLCNKFILLPFLMRTTPPPCLVAMFEAACDVVTVNGAFELVEDTQTTRFGTDDDATVVMIMPVIVSKSH